ncbi:MAG TPA: hypothetical protein VJ795_16835, partial [Rheinheimera sp.]|uniref:hypothetical protein n=1 Tax=Rheinheimera sp. TaxID=1869214 RepID=UPI002B48343C
RFNGQLPDINQITSLIEQQIAANKKLDEEGSVEGIAIPATPQKEKFEKGKSPTEDQVSAINAQIEIIHSATLTLNNLASLRLDKYTADINLIKACPALL